MRSGGSSQAGAGATPAQNPAASGVMNAVSHVDATVSEAVGNAGLPSSFVPLQSATPLLGAGGMPQVLYVGADFCPYCAAQRWSMVVALSRFGSFGHLDLTTSSSTDVYPDTATFTFRGMAYTSRFVDFVAVETSDRVGTPLQTLSPEQQSVYAKYDAPPYVAESAKGGIPWLDVGNRYEMQSSGFTPQVLAGLSWAQIAEKLGDAKDPVTRGIVGNANNITAAICKVTGMQPADVCSAGPVSELAAKLP
jgi:hypothetical protein